MDIIDILIARKGGSGGGGGSTQKADWTTNTTVGNLPANTNLSGKTAMEIFKAMTVTYVLPKGKVSYSATDSYVEKGKNLNVTITVNSLQKGEANLAKIEYYINGSLVKTVNSPNIATTYSYKATISEDSSIKVRLIDSNDKGVDIGQKKYSFVYPYYYGAVDNNNVTVDSVSNLTKIIRPKETINKAFNSNFQTVVYAYPSVYGNLSSIINQNNYEVVSSFKKTTLNINTIKYNVYYLENVNVSNFKYTFKF